MAETILTVNNIDAGYVKGLPILQGVNLELKHQQLCCIIGPNGAGKSTLIKSIAGLVSVFDGSIMFGGQDISRKRPDQMVGLGVAYVPQSDNIFRTLTISQNLALVLRSAGAAKEQRLGELYDLFPALFDKKNEKAGAMSGGQRQMLAVAMALALKPSVILMDEPSAGLSPKITEEVLLLTRGLTKQGVSVLLVEQNVKQALTIADHCYILAEGKNQLDGPAGKLLNDPVVAEIYIGGKRVEAT